MPAAEPDITVEIADARWDEAVPGDTHTCVVRAVGAAFAAFPVDGPVETGVRLTDDAEVQALNRAWRGQDKPTNVLSFALDEDRPVAGAPLPLGDVVVAFETCAREAGEADKTLADHLTHLVVHGTLHLLGFDHEDAVEAEAMENAERGILAKLGVADPYAGTEAA